MVANAGKTNTHAVQCATLGPPFALFIQKPYCHDQHCSPSEPVAVSGMSFKTEASSAGELRVSSDVHLHLQNCEVYALGLSRGILVHFILLLLIGRGTGGQGVKIRNCAFCDKLCKYPRI